MTKYKNLIYMLVSVLLVIYTVILTIYPAILNSSFNKIQFGEKAYKATGLLTSISNINFQITPGLTLIITIRNWSSQYIDYQSCFDADLIELHTGAFSPFTKDFPIKKMYLKHVKFSNQMLPEGVNKLAYLPKSFEASAFGAKKIKIAAGPVTVSDFRIKHIAPGFYKEDNRKESSYSKNDVKDFLNKLHIRFVEVR